MPGANEGDTPVKGRPLTGRQFRRPPRDSEGANCKGQTTYPPQLPPNATALRASRTTTFSAGLGIDPGVDPGAAPPTTTRPPLNFTPGSISEDFLINPVT